MLTVEAVREAHRLQDITEVKAGDVYYEQEVCIDFLLTKYQKANKGE